LKSIIIYHSCFTSFGGVETFCINLQKELSSKYNITLLSPQLSTLAFKLDNAEVINPKQKYQCDYLILATAWGGYPKNITATKTVQMVHAMYGVEITGWSFKYNKSDQTTHHVCVGDAVKQSFEEVTPYKCDAVIYNLLDKNCPIHPKQENDKLTLITASRISREKGFERMLLLSTHLNNEGVKFVWNVYGSINGTYAKYVIRRAPKNMVFHGYKPDVSKEVSQSDYIVQLSDSEGFPYSTYEALQQLTPVITTDYPSAKEQVKDGVNGWILDFDLSDWKKILENRIILTKFEHKSTLKDWVKFLEK
jgi:glycosyltransferase involved in cell wall biosynthesis